MHWVHFYSWWQLVPNTWDYVLIWAMKESTIIWSLYYVAVKCLHFGMFHMRKQKTKQKNKKWKETLESSQYLLEIIFNFTYNKFWN